VKTAVLEIGMVFGEGLSRNRMHGVKITARGVMAAEFVMRHSDSPMEAFR
jgi:hypothetical protein